MEAPCGSLLHVLEFTKYVFNKLQTWVSPLNLVESDEKPNIWQMKKKERKDFRRQQDENYDLVHGLKKLYETIRRCGSLKVVRLQI